MSVAGLVRGVCVHVRRGLAAPAGRRPRRACASLCGTQVEHVPDTPPPVRALSVASLHHQDAEKRGCPSRTQQRKGGGGSRGGASQYSGRRDGAGCVWTFLAVVFDDGFLPSALSCPRRLGLKSVNMPPCPAPGDSD